MDQSVKKKIMNNVMAMIPENVKEKLNSKYKGAVEENLSSKIFGTSFDPRNIKIGKQVKFLLHIRYHLILCIQGRIKNNWTLLPGTKIIGNQLYVNNNIFDMNKIRNMFT